MAASASCQPVGYSLVLTEPPRPQTSVGATTSGAHAAAMAKAERVRTATHSTAAPNATAYPSSASPTHFCCSRMASNNGR